MAIGLLASVALLVAIVAFFPWDLLRGPINRYVSEKTGRRFEITRHLDVKLGRTVRVVMDGIEFANPPWAQDPYLIRAEGAEFDIRLWPLLKREVVLPMVRLRSPQIGLQMEPDGRKTWALDRQDTGGGGTTPDVGTLQVDNGSLHFIAPEKGADIRVDIQLQEQADSQLPLRYDAKGTWQKQPFSASGRTGGILQLTDLAQAPPFPLEIDAKAGQTEFVAKGTIGSLATLENIAADVRMRGQSLSDLYGYLGVVLPTTPPYAVKARVEKQVGLWKVTNLQGKLGSSDMAGDLQYDQRQKVAKLSGNLVSERLDFNDLGPIIGLEPSATKGSRQTAAGAVPRPSAERVAKARKGKRSGKVLPTAKLDFSRLAAMDADVRFDAKRIQHVEQLPLQSLRTHVALQDGRLRLDPLDMTVAGGKLDGNLRIDSASSPAAIAVDLKGRGMQLNRLFPSIESTKSSLGELTAQVKLEGRGGSVAQLLGDVSGEVGVLTGSGRFSNLLMEFIGLDGGEVIRFFVRGDREVRLRCAAASFDVKKGVMTSKAIVFDTSDTVVYGDGRIDLGDETLALVLRPQPKDVSILSLRSPLKIGGTFADPSAFPDTGALAGRAAAAVALGIINPLLALAATVETGPGKDADCGQALRQTTAPKPASK
ncbi:MAG: AsmA family protein [Xylophilus ampelinus]